MYQGQVSEVCCFYSHFSDYSGSIFLNYLEDESSNCLKKPKENSTEPFFSKSVNIPVDAFFVFLDI